MNLTQIYKVEQIKDETLEVWVDIVKENKLSVPQITEAELKKLIKFATNTKERFSAFDKWASKISSPNDKILVG